MVTLGYSVSHARATFSLSNSSLGHDAIAPDGPSRGYGDPECASWLVSIRISGSLLVVASLRASYCLTAYLSQGSVDLMAPHESLVVNLMCIVRLPGSG